MSELYHNVTLSLLSDPSFCVSRIHNLVSRYDICIHASACLSDFSRRSKTLIMANVTLHRTVNIYVYSLRNLRLAYGINIHAAVIAGLVSQFADGTNYGRTFSSFLRTTRNPDSMISSSGLLVTRFQMSILEQLEPQIPCYRRENFDMALFMAKEKA